MHLSLSPPSSTVCFNPATFTTTNKNTTPTMAVIDNTKFFPYRSKSSSGLVLLRSVAERQSLRRSRSLPLPKMSSSNGGAENTEPQQHQQRQAQQCRLATCSLLVGREDFLALDATNAGSAVPPPPLCRWSSSPPCEQILLSAVSMVPGRARSMRNLRNLPPRLPIRRSGKAEELRSALPPKVPQRKPGVATMDKHALPPFMPKRNLDDSYENLSLMNANSFSVVSSTASSTRDSSFTLADDLEDSYSDLSCSSGDDSVSSDMALPDLHQELTSRNVSEEAIRHNLRNILGEVLEHLEDDLDF